MAKKQAQDKTSIGFEEENSIVLYQTEDGQTQIDVRLENDTVWLTANQMSLLFDRDEKTIRKHINNVFSEGELEKKNNTHFLRVVGVKQPVATYNLDVIISVGYRVKSKRGTAFRIWARNILKEYLVKGYAIPVVPQQQPCALSTRRHQTYSRQYSRCVDPDDCRKPNGGERCNSKGSCEAH